MDNWSNFQLLHNRQDEDYALAQLEAFTLSDQDGKALPNSTSITLPDPMIFSTAYLAIMGNDKMTIEIPNLGSKDSKKKIDPTIQSELESAFNMWGYNNDIYLEDCQQGTETYDFCQNWFIGYRGYSCSIVLMMQDPVDKEKFLPVKIPIDPRWAEWEYGSRGLKRFAYRTLVSAPVARDRWGSQIASAQKSDIAIEHEWDAYTYKINKLSFNTTGTELKERTELYDRDDKQSVRHNMGFVPANVTPVPSHPMLIYKQGGTVDKALAARGESIFAPVRHTIKDMNEFASIWASINKQQYMTPLVYTGLREQFKQRPFGWGIVIGLRPNETLTELRQRDVSPATMELLKVLFERFERATMSSVNFGQIDARASALLLSDLKSDRDKVFDPRRKCKAKHYQKDYMMLTRQIREEKFYKSSLTDDEAITIDKKMFEERFQVHFHFDSVTPQENIANSQLFANLRREGLPDSYLLRNILRVDDPEGLLREGKQQRLYSVLPILELADATLGWAGGDKAKEERINQMKFALGVKALDDFLSQPAQVEQPAGTASLPKDQTMIRGRSSPEVQSKQQSRVTGQQQMTDAMRGTEG
jgi:hypothetical protein